MLVQQRSPAIGEGQRLVVLERPDAGPVDGQLLVEEAPHPGAEGLGLW